MERHKNAEHLMFKLGISREEAEALIEFDKAVPSKPEVVKTAPKANKKAPAKPKAKATGTKEAVFAEVLQVVEDSDLTSGLQSLKANAVTFKDADGNYYTIALTAHKAAPNGYKGE